jgi:UDP-N-acetylglucosamine 2-epimerase (non-hydrolysing)
MPEEKYRTMIDHLSDVIYTYFDEYKTQGVLEGLNPKNIIVTGNIIVDVLEEFYWKRKDEYDKYANNDFFKKRHNEKHRYFTMTCHRRENISNKSTLKNILDFASFLKEKIYFPAGYRTQGFLREFSLKLPDNIILADPIGYKDLITLMINSKGVITDSGTVVEEACILQVKSIQMRTSTERPQVYDAKSSVKFDPALLGPSQFISVYDNFMSLPTKWNHNLGDGKASIRIAEDLTKRILNRNLNGHLVENYHIPTHRQYS